MMWQSLHFCEPFKVNAERLHRDEDDKSKYSRADKHSLAREKGDVHVLSWQTDNCLVLMLSGSCLGALVACWWHLHGRGSDAPSSRRPPGNGVGISRR